MIPGDVDLPGMAAAWCAAQVPGAGRYLQSERSSHDLIEALDTCCRQR